MLLDPVALAVSRSEHLHHPFHRFVIVGDDAIPVGAAGRPRARSNTHSPG